MEESKLKTKEKTTMLIVLILIVLIVIAFLLISCLGKIDHNYQLPTGNVDIFDLIFGSADCECICENQENKNDTTCDNNCNSNDTETVGSVVVYDDEKIYSTSTPLRIFTHSSYFVVNDVIAPESSNSYQFVVRNNNDFNIKYNFEMIEENIYNINMKFRLKINGEYVAGNEDEYATLEELNQHGLSLASKNYDVYTLDWKWFESENDTKIGTNINSNDKLNLKMSATQF